MFRTHVLCVVIALLLTFYTQSVYAAFSNRTGKGRQALRERTRARATSKHRWVKRGQFGDRNVLRDGYEWEEPMALHEDDPALLARRLASGDHEDVATDIEPVDDEVASDWEHDFDILSPALARRGYDVSGATKLCELPRVYCDYGYRRRVPTYASKLMGDWVGTQYALVLLVQNESTTNSMDGTLFDLRRVGFFQVQVNGGVMPAGIEKLTNTSVVWITGMGSGGPGIEGGLPDGFWNLQTRMFLLVLMGSDFNATLPATLELCSALDYRFYLYELPGLVGDVSALGDCVHLTSVAEVYGLPKVTGNAWQTTLNMNKIQDLIDFTGSGFTGLIPHASTEYTDPSQDPWRAWCASHAGGALVLRVEQEVGGPLPKGLEDCAYYLSFLDVRNSNLTGDFPINFTFSTVLDHEGLQLSNNQFTGPIPDAPPQTTTALIYRNRWSGDLPISWHSAPYLVELDLTDCEMSGPIINVSSYITTVVLANNHFTGTVPASWKDASLSHVDLSNNNLVGMPFTWAWPGADVQGNFDSSTLAEAWVHGPDWPLAYLSLADNPLDISAGFLMGALSVYEIEELDLSNCSLNGRVMAADLVPSEPLAAGGTATAGGIAFTKLRTLDLSNNDIESFGYELEGAAVSSCWAGDWGSLIPSLDKFYLSDCPSLLRLPTEAYTMTYLDIQGCPKLQGPTIYASKDDCDDVFLTQDELCTEVGLTTTCLYLSGQYAEYDGNIQCTELSIVLEDGSGKPSVVVDPLIFQPEVMCACDAGHEWLEEGVSCQLCASNTYRSWEMEKCSSCPALSETVDDTGLDDISACKCAAGHFMSNGECETCPSNTYSSTVGATSMDACLQCTVGTVTANLGSNSSDDCVCPAGKTLEGGYCVECVVGRFKDTIGDQECTACTSDGMIPSGYFLTTSGTGTEAKGQCVCPSGTYEPADGSAKCKLCPEGMACSSANASEAAIFQEGASIPAAASGYMTLVQAPMVPYKCWQAEWCPGGGPGTCAHGRDATTVGCGSCPDGTFTASSGDCTECNGTTSIIVMSAGLIAGFICLYGVAVMVNRRTSSEPKSTTTILIVGALTVTAVQTLGVLSGLAVTWMEPVRTMLRLLAAFSFDLDALQAECLVGQTPARSYGIRQLVAPGAGLYMTLVIYWRKLQNPSTNFIHETVNAVGAAYQAFFVSIVVSILLPFVCYSHPGGIGASMTSQPSVMCFNNGTHVIMLAVGALSLLVSVFPFLALVNYAVWTYKRASADSSKAVRHLSLFRFLFFRFKPEAYYYSLVALTRSLLICLVPVIARDAAAVQLASMVVIFQGFLLIQLYTQPWRSDFANLTDALLACLLVLLVACVSMAGSFDDASSVAGAVGAFVVSSIFATSLGMLCSMIYRRLKPNPFFHKFICHHKADAAAQARFLQICIRQKLQENCFLDSDHLQNLDNLLDTVRCQTGRLVVFLTSDTMRRPWCAAEITTTSETHKRIVRIRTPSFQCPEASECSVKGVLQYVHPAEVNMVELGITVESISKAYNWFLSSEVMEIAFPTELVGTARFYQVTQDLSRVSYCPPSNNIGNTARQNSGPTVKMKETLEDEMIAVSGHPDKDEAIAAVGIIVSKLQPMVVEFAKRGICCLPNVGANASEEVLHIVVKARAVVIVLSQGSLESSAQLSIILAAMRASAVPGGQEVVPVFTPDFRFPDGSYYESLQNTELTAELALALQSLFKRIAVGIATHASESVIDAQIKDIAGRLKPTVPRSGHSPRTLVSVVDDVAMTHFLNATWGRQDKRRPSFHSNGTPSAPLDFLRGVVPEQHSEIEPDGFDIMDLTPRSL